jgi:IS30 family transposase
MSGSPLTLEERYLIHTGFVAKLPFAEIAAGIGRDRSVIYDEYARGADSRGRYCPHRAQRHRDAASARSAANAPRKPQAEWDQVKRLLKQGWSPERISGRRALLQEASVSFQAIYAAAGQNNWTRWLYTALIRRHLKRPARRPYCGSAQSIHDRAKAVLARLDIGHWEADTAIGKKTDVMRMLVMIERQTLYMQLGLLKQVTAQRTAQMMKRRLDSTGIPFESVTTDRGGEFGATGDVMPGKAYVCDPHAPNQRGTNENQIGMLRADLPKSMSMDGLTPTKLRRIEEKYNHMPRKSLGFLTPHEVAFNCPPRVGTRT